MTWDAAHRPPKPGVVKMGPRREEVIHPDGTHAAAAPPDVPLPTSARAHRPECLSLAPEPVYDDGTPNPCDCRILSLIESRGNPDAADRLLAAVERVGGRNVR